jgi:triphosphoribosyl-dephospho-CoA synthase
LIEPADVASAFIASCHAEIEALKPGNVHRYAAGHGMIAEEFLLSASAAAGPLTLTGADVGRRILGAVEATLAAVGKNTNLGILLLCGPLAAAAELAGTSLRENLAVVLARLDRQDSQDVFAAIRLASPAGLGTATRHDVHGPAEADLGEIMAEAAPRDRIARQYVSGYDDIFVTGFDALAWARSRDLAPDRRTTFVYLTFLAAFPDTHLMRKCGNAAAVEVQAKGRAIFATFERNDGECLDELVALDGELKAAGRNPGTSADLTVATLFADRLCGILLRNRNDG